MPHRPRILGFWPWPTSIVCCGTRNLWRPDDDPESLAFDRVRLTVYESATDDLVFTHTTETPETNLWITSGVDLNPGGVYQAQLSYAYEDGVNPTLWITSERWTSTVPKLLAYAALTAAAPPSPSGQTLSDDPEFPDDPEERIAVFEGVYETGHIYRRLADRAAELIRPAVWRDTSSNIETVLEFLRTRRHDATSFKLSTTVDPDQRDWFPYTAPQESLDTAGVKTLRCQLREIPA